MKQVSTTGAPAAIGPYSQAVQVGGMLYVSGQIGIDPENGSLREGFSAQARQVFSNLAQILSASEMSWRNVIRVRVFLMDMANFGELNTMYAEYFTEPYPAREVVGVTGLPAGAVVEISLEAAGVPVA